jgi:two-component system sensor histidine kinase YesM
VLKLILQPLVENAIYHGLEKKQGEWMLKVKSYVVGERLCLEIKDNGIGLSEESLSELENRLFHSEQKTKSMGLKNVYDRLKILFEDNFDFSIDSIEGIGTKIKISIPAILGDELDIYRIKLDKN